VRWRCGLMSIYFDHLFIHTVIIYYLRREQAVTPLLTTPEKCYRTACKMQNFVWLNVIWVPQRSAEIKPMSQQDASATCPSHGLVLRSTSFVEHGTKINGQYLLSRCVADAEAAISDPQHCWRRVCVLGRQCASTRARDTVELLRSSPWDTAVHHSCYASQRSWPQPSRLPRLGHAARARVSSTIPRYRRVVKASSYNMGWISRGAWPTMQLISGEKDWMRYLCRRWSL